MPSATLRNKRTERQFCDSDRAQNSTNEQQKANSKLKTRNSNATNNNFNHKSNNCSQQANKQTTNCVQFAVTTNRKLADYLHQIKSNWKRQKQRTFAVVIARLVALLATTTQKRFLGARNAQIIGAFARLQIARNWRKTALSSRQKHENATRIQFWLFASRALFAWQTRV